MGQFVQLPDKKGVQTWHAVESAADEDGGGKVSQFFLRKFKTGCGLTEVAAAHLLLESAKPPWTNRHVAKGCFATAADPQPKES